MPAAQHSRRLESWKAIARHLNRSVRTVRRWEKSDGLPVHRHLHERGASVYALVEELDAWTRGQGQPADAALVRSQRRAWVAAAGAGLVLAGLLVLAAFRPPARDFGTVAPPWILVAEFATDERTEAYRGVFEHLVRSNLEDRSMRVATRERVADVLRLMGLEPDTPLTQEMALEVASRDGEIGLLVSGQVTTSGPSVVIEASIREFDESQPDEAPRILTSVIDESRDLLAQLRSRANELGEAVADVQIAAHPVTPYEPRVTTASMEALQQYAAADRLIPLNRTSEAVDHLLEAVRLDPEFAVAHLWLSYHHPDPDRRRHHVERARALAPGVSERERLFIEASYHGHLGDRRKEIEAYEVLLRFYPDHFHGNTNLRARLHTQGRWREMLPISLRLADSRPSEVRSQWMALQNLMILEQHQQASGYADRIINLGPQGVPASLAGYWAFGMLAPAYMAWTQGQDRHALGRTDAAVRSASEMPAPHRAKLLELAASFALGLAEFDLAERYLDQLEALVPATPVDSEVRFDIGNPLDRTARPGLQRLWLALARSDEEAFRDRARQLAHFDDIAFYLAWAGPEPRAADVVEGMEGLSLPDYQRVFLLNTARGAEGVWSGRWDEALSWLEAANDHRGLSPARVTAQAIQIEHLARAYLATGRPREAQELLQTIDAMRPTLLALNATGLYAWYRCDRLRHTIREVAALARD